jgi:hypothetical protein
VKVHLIRRRDRRHPAFYSEDPEVVRDLDPDAADRPPRGRIERWARQVKAAVLRTRHRAGPRTARLMDWLMRRPNPDEALLRGLRSASAVELVHPASMSPDRARRLWVNYLRHRRRQQLGAASWDILMVAITAPMLITPGPGVLAFWFLYRVLNHLLAMFGTFRGLSRRTALGFAPCAALDCPVAPGDAAPLARIAAECDLKALTTYLRRLEKRTATPDPAEPPAPRPAARESMAAPQS